MKCWHTVGLVWVGLMVWGAPGASQIVPLPLRKAAQATELPVGAWGTYSRAHLGPCYLAQRFPGQLFSFPIVIGQKRQETVLQTVTLPNGKKTLKQSEVVLRRRAMGLAPVNAQQDDGSALAKTVAGNRSARITDADADGYLWESQLEFESAKVVQKVAALPDESGKLSIPEWGAGSAKVTCFPAFADPAADGLMIRVRLSNRSATSETWFVDLLSGLDTITEQFLPDDLSLQQVDDQMVMTHAKCSQAFALAARAPVPASPSTVTETYFAAGANSAPATPQEAPAAAKQDATTGKKATWGLERVDDVVVEPGQEVTLWLCIGVGKDSDAAIASARTLLHLAEDAGPGHPGAYSRALAIHGASRFASGDSTLDRLMAVSLTDVPFNNLRRLANPTRDTERSGGVYRPEEGGWIALGWSGYRPDWAATELNAWFSTRSDPEAPLNPALALPASNLLALWELFQNTGDRGLISAFYPAARHRYRELRAGGRIHEGDWLFAWAAAPAQKDAAITERRYAPDCSAQLIRSALILYRMAQELGRPEEEGKEYLHDAQEAGTALSNGLWDPDSAIFIDRPVPHAVAQPASITNDPKMPAPVETLNGLMPLIAGTDFITPEQSQALLRKLKDPEAFFSPYGLRSMSKRCPGYNSADRDHGGIRYGENWMLWKALLDLGEAETANRLAAKLLNGYHQAVAAQNLCPEWLDAENGRGMGAVDWSGDACVLLALDAAYHKPGVVSGGWDSGLLDHHYDTASDLMRIVFRPQGTGYRGVLLCVMGKPGATYAITGDLTQTVKSDKTGVVQIALPDKKGTQQIQIAPAKDPGTAQ